MLRKHSPNASPSFRANPCLSFSGWLRAQICRSIFLEGFHKLIAGQNTGHRYACCTSAVGRAAQQILSPGMSNICLHIIYACMHSLPRLLQFRIRENLLLLWLEWRLSQNCLMSLLSRPCRSLLPLTPPPFLVKAWYAGRCSGRVAMKSSEWMF